MGRRILAFLLSMALTVSMVPVSTFGAEILPEETAAVTAETGAVTEETAAATVQNTLPAEIAEPETSASATEETVPEETTLTAGAEAMAATTVAYGDILTNGLHWVLQSDGGLYIQGRGKMPNYSNTQYSNTAPWFKGTGYPNVKKLKITAEIPRIGTNAFEGTLITEVTIPEWVEEVGARSFRDCVNLTSVTLSEGVTTLEADVFAGCTSLTEITVPVSVTSIGAGALGTAKVTYQGTMEQWKKIGLSGQTAVCTDGTIFAWGSCGTSVSWEIDGNGCMTISGSGSMGDFDNIPTWTKNYAQNIKSVEIRDGVTYIGKNAFFGCSKLRSVHIPESVTGIGDYAFDNCHALHTITVPTSIASVGRKAFGVAQALYQGTKDQWKTVGNCGETVTCTNGPLFAWGSCGDGVNWEIDDKNHMTVSGTGDMSNYSSTTPWAKNYAQSIQTLEIQEGVTSIGNYGFYGCSALHSVSLPESLKRIGTMAFMSCGSLETITVPVTVTSIQSSSVGVDTVVHYPGTKEQWKAAAVSGSYSVQCNDGGLHGWGTCGDALTWEMDRENTLTISGTGRMNSYTGGRPGPWNGSIWSPEKVVIEEGVTSIGNYAFTSDSITEVIVPATVTQIDFSAFYNCSATVYYAGTREQLLQAAPDGLPGVDKAVASDGTLLSWGYCGDKATFVLDEAGTLTVSGSGELWDDEQYLLQRGMLWSGRRKDVKNLVVEEGITALGEYTFYEFAMESVTLPASLQSIGKGAFVNTQNLKAVHISNLVAWCGVNNSGSLFSNGVELFVNEEQLVDLVVPEGVTSIGTYAFADLTALRSVRFPESLITIGTMAFSGCSQLTQLQLPEGLTGIGDRAFSGCVGVTSVHIPASVEYIGTYVFEKELKTIDIADLTAWCKVDFSNQYAWQGSKTMTLNGNVITDLVIPEGVETIGCNAFLEVESLRSVTFPASVKEIGQNTFANCTGISKIVFYGDAPYMESWSFENVRAEVTYDPIFPGWTPERIYGMGDGLIWKPVTCFAGHIPQVDLAVAPTCTETGLTEGSSCATCGEILVAQQVVPETGHSPVTDAYLAPTCTETGLTEGSHCSVCEEIFVAQEEIPATGHTEVEDPAVDFTCTGDGLTQGSHCGVCNVVLVAQEVVPAHHIEVEDPAVAHTCTETGLTEGKHCEVCQEILIAQEVIPAAHTAVVTDEAIASTCTSTGLTEGSHCEACGEVFVPQEETAILPHNMSGGKCLDCSFISITWEIGDDGTLTVSGSDQLANFASAWDTPWYNRRYEITALVVEEGVTAIGSYAFANLNSLRSVVLPESVQTIGSFAFSGCGSMRELSFPASALVEEGAFEGCSGLRRITVTPGTGDMRDYDKTTSQYLPWQYGSGYVIFSEGVRSIGDYAFYDVRRIEQVFLPDSLRIIGCASFGHNSIPRIQVPEGVTTLGDFAFSEAVALETITLPGSIRNWGKTLFAGSGLVTAQLPEGMTQIPEEMFHTCEKLEIVNIPSTVREIGTEAFCNCPELWDVTLPEGVRIIGEHAFSYSGISHITFPSSLEYISDYAFYACDAMRTVTIPENTKRVGIMAFAHSDKIHSVVINTLHLVVDSGAFKNCYSLDSVYFCGGPGLWDVGYVPQEGEFGVYLNTSDNLTSAKMYYNNDYVPVDRINIKDSGGKFGKAGSVLNGRTIYVDINKVKSFSLSFETLPKNASRAETTVLLRDFGNTAPAAIKVSGKTITLSQLKCGEATVFVQNYSPKMVAQLGYNPYTYATATVRFIFYSPVTGIAIFGDDQGYLPMNETRTLRAEVTPANAEVMGVLWTVQNGTGAGTIDEYGRFTGTRAGTVTIRAAAVDGSGITAEKTITVYDEYSLAISGPETVAAGKSITLKAAFVPFNITNTKILWRLKDPADGAYVTLSGGKVTAGKVDRQRVVTVLAESADGKARAAEYQILVVPVTASVAVTANGEAVAGGTAVWDLNDPDQGPLVFEARTWPEDAADEILWTVSDKTGTYGRYRIEGNTLTVMDPTGKTGTVTLTAAATDGSGKKAAVKLQFTRLAQNVEILEAPQEIRGGSKVNLKTNVALDKTLTDKNILWSLSEDSVPYATVTAQGVLTTQAVQEPVEITVVASLKANPQRRSEIRIRLMPSASDVRIGVNGQWKQKNETVYVDLANPTVTLQGAILPENAIASGSWKLSSAAMARMEEREDGTVSVTLLKAGTVTVTFTAGDGSKKNTAVKLQGVLLTKSIGLHAPKGETELRSGKTLQLKTAPGTAQPGVAPTIKKYSWSVSDPKAASVSATGSVKALPVSENTPVTVTAEATDGSGIRESYELLIKPAAEQTLVIRLNRTEDITGDTRFLGAVFDGVSALPQERLSAWVYDSEADTYTQVDAVFTAAGKVLHLAAGDGVWTVSPMAYGTAALTVKYGKLTAKVNYKSVRFVEGITVSSKTGADWVLAGKSLNLAAEITNSDATVKKLSWSVDDPTAATVSATGVVKAGAVTKRTTVTVTAAATDGSGVSGSFALTIYPTATGIRIREKATGRVMNNRTITVSLDQQQTLSLESLVYPAGETGALEAVVYTCTGQGARIDGEGNITFLKKGTVTIKVTAADGSRISASFKIVIQ